MATKTNADTTAEPRPTVAAARAEVTKLRALASGAASRWVTRTTRRGYITATGAAAEGNFTEDVLVTEPVDALARLRAQQALPTAELRLLEAEVQEEQARQHAAVEARQVRDQLVAEGVALVRAELPELVRQQRRLQRLWNDFHTKCEALDLRLGERRFAEASWPAVMQPGAQFDAFVAACRAAYQLDVD